MIDIPEVLRQLKTKGERSTDYHYVLEIDLTSVKDPHDPDVGQW